MAEGAPVSERFMEVVRGLPGLLDELVRCVPTGENTPAPKSGGAYLLTEGSRHMYVGRARNLRMRRRGHLSQQHNQATFAFELAREAPGKEATYTPAGSRADLMTDPAFRQALQIATARVAAMAHRYVVVEDALGQCLLEIYAAVELQTPYNSWETT